jgi:hypothetical protein
LTEKSREFKCFSDGSLREMNIDLFTVSGCSLERNGKSMTVHQNLSLDLSVGLSSSQDIHESGFTSTGRTHHGGKSTSFTVSENVVEQFSRLLVGLDSVVEIFPGERAIC